MLSQTAKPFTGSLIYLVTPITGVVCHLNAIPFSSLAIISTILMLLDVVSHGSSLMVSIATGVFWSLLGQQSLLTSHQSASRRRARSLRRRTLMALGIGILLLITVMSYPAHAQFFGGAETWMQANFGANAGEAIPLVFNVLRGLFLLYVGVALVRVINAARQDEDWQTIARTPLIIIIAVTAGDILTTLITG